MIRLVPVETPNKSPGKTENDHQQFIVYADQPVTISVAKIPSPRAEDGVGIHALIYRGVLKDDDQETEPVGAYDGSRGHAANRE